MRRRLGDELKVEKIPMSHSVPLKYEFLNMHNMCEEALQIGEQCMIRQLVTLLKESPDALSREFDAIFDTFAPDPPYDGLDWRDVGISTEMICSFAEKRGINLYVFHGTRKIQHIKGGSEQFLTYFNWDNHCYFARTSQRYGRIPVF